MVRRTHESPSTSAEAAIDLTGSDSHDDDNLEMEDVDMDAVEMDDVDIVPNACLLYTSPSPRDRG